MDLKTFLQNLKVLVLDPTPYEETFDCHSQFIRVDDIESIEAFEILTETERGLPKGSVVHRDEVESFQNELSPEERRNLVIVAGTAEGLRCVFPEINGSTEKVETVIDGGSQIVAVDACVAQGVGLKWDPNTVIHMQSANGQLQPTLGLCRNVPFKFGDVTVYLQLHVVAKAPFQVLLGRPFDVLTESQVRNFKDGDQWVTVTCPNSGQQCVVPTYGRGQGIRITIKNEPSLRPQNAEADRQERENHGSETTNFQSTLMI